MGVGNPGFGVIQGYARLRKAVHGYARLCKAVHGYARLRKAVYGYARLCKAVRGYARLCKLFCVLEVSRIIPSPSCSLFCVSSHWGLWVSLLET